MSGNSQLPLGQGTIEKASCVKIAQDAFSISGKKGMARYRYECLQLKTGPAPYEI